MSSKPETKFYGRVNRLVPQNIYRLKNNNPYAAGVADFYYSCRGGSDMWVEYKYIDRMPVRTYVDPGVTALQADWLRDRHDDGRNVAIIVGASGGGVIFRVTEPWILSPAEFKMRIIPDAAIAEWIVEQTKTTGHRENASTFKQRSKNNYTKL